MVRNQLPAQVVKTRPTEVGRFSRDACSIYDIAFDEFVRPPFTTIHKYGGFRREHKISCSVGSRSKITSPEVVCILNNGGPQGSKGGFNPFFLSFFFSFFFLRGP